MRWRATRAQSADVVVDGDAVDHPPATSSSSTQHRWAASMRNMVEHGQISGSRDGIVRSGCSSASRWTRWISVAMASGGAGAAASLDGLDDEVGLIRPGRPARPPRGCTRDGRRRCPSGWLGPEGGDVLGPEALVDRAVALPEQEAGLLDVPLVEAAQALAGVPDRHVGRRVAELVAGVAAQVLVGEEQHLGRRAALAERPGQDGPGVGRGAHRPAVAADERLQGGGGVHVGDRDHGARCR